MRSLSSSPGLGAGPMPRMPFTLWKTISRSAGMKSETMVGRPMPRLTQAPSSMSCAARHAIWRRVNGFMVPPLSHDDDAVDEDAGRHHAFGIEHAEIDHLAYLHRGERCRHRHHRVEIACRFAIGGIAPAVGAVGTAERNVAPDR